ncbi:MAG: AsmA family protein [Rhodospirillaceae bacterium]|jgi:AsmA family protein|nr:AsmA family protein [Rhodospirillaceae bacterium]
MRIRLSTLLKGLMTLMVAVVVTAVAILYSTDFSAYKGDIETLIRDATGRELVIEGEFKPTLSLTPSVVVDRVRFSNAGWGSRKDMARIGKLRAELELLPAFFGEIRIKQVVLSGADILLETGVDGTGNWVMGPQKAEIETAKSSAAPLIPTFDKILIEDSRITWRDGRSGTRSTVRIDRLRAQASTLQVPVRFGLKGAYNDHPIKLDGSVGSLNKVTGGGTLPLDLTFSAGGAVGAVKGAIRKPALGQGVALRLSASGKDLAALNDLLGADLPAIGPYGLSATLSDQGRRWHFKDLQLSLGGSDLSGTLTLDPGVSPVAIVATLRSTLLREVDFRDRDATISAVRPIEKRVATSGALKDERIFSDDPLSLAGLSGAHVKTSLRAKRIETSEAVLEEASAQLLLQRGNLTLRQVKATYAGGAFSGDLDLKTAAGTPEITFKVDIAKLDLAKIIKEAGHPGLLTGAVDARASLSGRGSSVRSIMAGLNGTIDVTMNGGHIDRKLLDLLGSDAFEALSPWSSENKGIEIKCLVGRYRVRNGQLKSQATVFDTDRLLVVGEGGVNLATEAIDFVVTPTARDISLLKLIVALDVGGTLASPTVLPDPAAMARGAVGVAAGIVTGQVIGTVIGSILSDSSDSDKNNPCLAALSGTSKNSPSPLPRDSTGSPVKDVEKAIEGIGEGLKELFGR